MVALDTINRHALNLFEKTPKTKKTKKVDEGKILNCSIFVYFYSDFLYKTLYDESSIFIQSKAMNVLEYI